MQYNVRFESCHSCSDYSGCPYKSKCLYNYNDETDRDKNKIMTINELGEALQAESHLNITNDKGILNKQIRSIQTKGHFGYIKKNGIFRRFHYRSTEKTYKEFLLFAIEKNINKYHRFSHGQLSKFEGKSNKKTALKKCAPQKSKALFRTP